MYTDRINQFRDKSVLCGHNLEINTLPTNHLKKFLLFQTSMFLLSQLT